MDDFVYVGLGPFSAEDGEWCCGLNCGQGQGPAPCPFGLKIRPKGKTRDEAEEAKPETASSTDNPSN